MNIVTTNFDAMSPRERLRHLELQGYVVLPRLLDASTIVRLKSELADLPMNAAPYSPEQTFAARPPQWHSRTFAELIGYPPLIGFLRLVLGDDIIFMLGHFVRSGPGVPGLTLHSDYEPYGSQLHGMDESSPVTLRVLIYLDDLTPERAPFTFLPYSHLTLHEDGNVYARYDKHPDMITVCLEAGSAVVFNVRAFHGTHPNTSADFTRGMIELAYRPAWARSAATVDEWDPELVARAPEVARPFLRGRNAAPKQPPTPPAIDASRGVPGISPRRWDSSA
jgi:hypothetical protein